MELDELKKTWNLLDEKLKQETLADTRQIEALIASCKDKAGRGVDSLARNQRLSMWLGGVVGVALLVVGGLFSFLLLERPVRLKMLVLLLFSALSIAIGVLWDRKTFQWLRQLKVDEMSPFEVSQRIVTLYRWTRCEVVAVAVWAVLFIMLDYWVMDFYLRPLAGQVAFFVVALLFMGLLVGIAYWRLVYRHLDDIKKNIEELKTICTE